MRSAKRYLEYRKVLRLEPCPETLEQALRQAWVKLPSKLERVIPRFDGSSVMGFSLTDHGEKGVSVHCVRYVDKQGVGVIPMVEGKPQSLSEKKPLTDENFLDRDFFLLASGDNVITLNASAGAAMARTFLIGLVKKANLLSSHEKFDLVQVANVKALRRITAGGGVKSIQLDLSLGELAADFALAKVPGREGVFQSIVGRIGELITAVGREDGASGLSESEKGSVRLTINVPNGDVQPAKAAALALGEAIVGDEDADDFLLTLSNGDQIRKTSVSIKKQVTLGRNANSFVASEVETEMLEFMNALINDGQTKVA